MIRSQSGSLGPLASHSAVVISVVIPVFHSSERAEVFASKLRHGQLYFGGGNLINSESLLPWQASTLRVTILSCMVVIHCFATVFDYSMAQLAVSMASLPPPTSSPPSSW